MSDFPVLSVEPPPAVQPADWLNVSRGSHDAPWSEVPGEDAIIDVEIEIPVALHHWRQEAASPRHRLPTQSSECGTAERHASRCERPTRWTRTTGRNPEAPCWQREQDKLTRSRGCLGTRLSRAVITDRSRREEFAAISEGLALVAQVVDEEVRFSTFGAIVKG